MHILFQILQPSGDDSSGCAARIWPFRKRFPCGTACFVPISILYCQLVHMTTQHVDMLMRNSLLIQLMSDDIASGWEMR